MKSIEKKPLSLIKRVIIFIAIFILEFPITQAIMMLINVIMHIVILVLTYTAGIYDIDQQYVLDMFFPLAILAANLLFYFVVKHSFGASIHIEVFVKLGLCALFFLVTGVGLNPVDDGVLISGYAVVYTLALAAFAAVIGMMFLVDLRKRNRADVETQTSENSPLE